MRRARTLAAGAAVAMLALAGCQADVPDEKAAPDKVAFGAVSDVTAIAVDRSGHPTTVAADFYAVRLVNPDGEPAQVHAVLFTATAPDTEPAAEPVAQAGPGPDPADGVLVVEAAMVPAQDAVLVVLTSQTRADVAQVLATPGAASITTYVVP